jgi:integrase/recombinase XerD
MLELGMRCTEVASIRLSDIYRHDATIKLQKTKTKKERLLPISKKLGKLLEEYVINYRPHTNNEYLFLRKGLYNQYVPMNFHSIRSVVRNAFQKENITGWWKGTHTLRRTAASHIFNAGNGIKLTADILGHKSLDSTTAYIKVDFESLRKTASRWPGGVSHE